LHVAALTPAGAPVAATLHSYRESYEPEPSTSLHVLPEGQQANCEPGQHTAFTKGQHPTPEGLKPEGQQVDDADGQRVSFHAEYGPPVAPGHSVSHCAAAREARSRSSAARAPDDEREEFILRLSCRNATSSWRHTRPQRA